MSEYILSAVHIEKSYGQKKILTDVNINIRPGEIYGLIGKNGSGKTTFLRIITGLITDYKGKVITSQEPEDNFRVSAVIGSPSLYLNMTAYDNLKIQSMLLGYKDDRIIKDSLELVGLENSRVKIKNFSLGMTQRLRLAAALISSPKLLILDEPINGLDPDAIAGLRHLLTDLNRERKITIIISSHILGELEHTACRFGILHDGMIRKEITSKELKISGISLEELYLQNTYKGGV
ncbi:MAG: ATP-binding cassette domain-containing protein [Oscillospiraceae bacterium]|nr:ATP-binding cassette domain-containing protein [Oscillospiraceae bacterium]